MKLKLSEALNLLEAIKTLQITSFNKSLKVGYILSYNKKVLEDIQINIQENFKSLEPDFEQTNAKLIEFEQKRISKLEELADKHADGSPIIVDGNYSIQDADSIIPQLMLELETEYYDSLVKFQNRNKHLNELLETTQDFNLIKIPFSLLPEEPIEGIDPKIMDSISTVIHYDVV